MTDTVLSPDSEALERPFDTLETRYGVGPTRPAPTESPAVDR